MHTDLAAVSDRFVHALHGLEREGESAVAPMLALFADDATVDNAALTLADDDRRGREAIEAFWIAYARQLRGARTEFGAVTVGEATIGLFWITRRPADAGERPVDYHGATLLRVDDAGRVAAMRGYYDTRAV